MKSRSRVVFISAKRFSTVCLFLATLLLSSQIQSVFAQYLNEDPSRQRPVGNPSPPRENFSPVHWLIASYLPWSYTGSDPTIRNDIVSAMSQWTSRIPYLQFSEGHSDYTFREVNSGFCSGIGEFECVRFLDPYYFQPDHDANYPLKGEVLFNPRPCQQTPCYTPNSITGVFVHAIGHLLGMKDSYLSGGLCSNSQSIMDGMKKNSLGLWENCGGLWYPHPFDMWAVNNYWRDGNVTGLNGLDTGGGVAIWRWYDLSWAEWVQRVGIFREETPSGNLIPVGGVYVMNNIGAHVTTESRLLGITFDRNVANVPPGWYIACVQSLFVAANQWSLPIHCGWGPSYSWVYIN